MILLWTGLWTALASDVTIYQTNVYLGRSHLYWSGGSGECHFNTMVLPGERTVFVTTGPGVGSILHQDLRSPRRWSVYSSIEYHYPNGESSVGLQTHAAIPRQGGASDPILGGVVETLARSCQTVGSAPSEWLAMFAGLGRRDRKMMVSIVANMRAQQVERRPDNPDIASNVRSAAWHCSHKNNCAPFVLFLASDEPWHHDL